MMKLAGILLSLIVRLLRATLRIRHVNAAVARQTPHYIFAFWHSHLLLMLHSIFRRPITVLSSTSRDGDLAVWVYWTYGVKAVRGSSTHGGSAAIREVIRRARHGSNLAFTPDGPKGPPRRVKDGVVFAAQMTGLPIIPVAFGADRKKLLGSWDRMVIPKPFSRAVFVYGEAILVDRHGDAEAARLKVEDALNALAERVESNFEEVWRSA
ncbi:MAG: lysophospholipid acyltransferase family protein [Acidobacteriota bacterium]